MRPEVQALLSSLSEGSEIDWKDARREIVDLHRTSVSPEERSLLLGTYVALMNLVERSNAVDDLPAFREARRQEHNLMLITEATDGQNVVPALLHAVTKREIAAGRIQPDHELHKLAEAGDMILTPEPPKKGLFSRLLGR